MSELVLVLSESLILPFDITNYAKFLHNDLNKLESRYSERLSANGASFGNNLSSIRQVYWNCYIYYLLWAILDYFRKAVNKFQNATQFFVETTLPHVDITK